MRLNTNAVKNPSTLKPSTNFSAKMIMTAFITKRNKPKEKMVMGIVNTVNIGLKMAFKNAKTTATISADWYPLKWTPGKNLAIKKTARAEKNIFSIKLILVI